MLCCAISCRLKVHCCCRSSSFVTASSLILPDLDPTPSQPVSLFCLSSPQHCIEPHLVAPRHTDIQTRLCSAAVCKIAVRCAAWRRGRDASRLAAAAASVDRKRGSWQLRLAQTAAGVIAQHQPTHRVQCQATVRSPMARTPPSASRMGSWRCVCQRRATRQPLRIAEKRGRTARG